MSDAVSKLYAEIGFKVNQDGLKQAQALLKGIAKQMSDINNATKEAARQYGIFSKDRNKQDIANAKLAIENEKAENQRNKRKLDNKKFEHKQLMDLAKLEFQVEKYNANEKAQAERKQNKEAERAAKEQQKRLKALLGGFRSFAVGLRNTFLGLAGVGGIGITAGIAQSLGRSIPTRDFLMATGVSLSELQGVMQRMVNVGSSLNQQQIMGDILKVSQSLEDIRLGGGGIVPYKLAGVAATGKVMDVIRATEEAVKDMNNATALNLTRRVGLSDDWLAAWRFKQRYGGDQVQLSKEQNLDIANARVALGQLAYGFRLLSDQITAVLSPAFEEVSDLIRDSFQSAARYIKTHSAEIKIAISEITKKIVKFIREIDWEKVWHNIKDFGNGLLELARTIHRIISKLGFGEEKKESSREGMYLEEHWWGGRWKPITKYEPSAVGKYIDKTLSPDTLGMINSFSSTPRKSGIIDIVDNHVQNVTINANGEDELIEKIADVVEEKEKSNKEIWQDRFSDINQLWVVGHSSGNASVG